MTEKVSIDLEQLLSVTKAGTHDNALEEIARNDKYIPGGISSTNRAIEPSLVFTHAKGAYLWDTDGNKYIDYHAGFSPYFLGHNFEVINQCAIDVLKTGASLFGAGRSLMEGKLAELICQNVAAVDKVTFLNTGSEAVSLSIRLSRVITAKNHFIVIQGGYNGNHDELACNLFNTVDEVGPRVSPGEYPIYPLGAGTALPEKRYVHAINFNDLESVRYVCARYPVAALITEPILQNIGLVKPNIDYLEGLRALADELDFLLIFDEVKTGFRHALGGYSSLSNVRPDLVVYGKAVANGFPLALLGGKAEYMDYIVHDDSAKRPFVAGTYNGHPVAVAAAFATVKYLADNQHTVYDHVERLGMQMEEGFKKIFADRNITVSVPRQGSAFSFYFMDHDPEDMHDIIGHHDFEADVRFRRDLLKRGVFFIPIATKQCSISASHSADDIDETLKSIAAAVGSVLSS